MKPTIIISAANGFLGKALTKYLSEQYRIIGLVRKKIPDTHNIEYKLWDGKTLGEWATSFEGAFAVINLAGRSVDCRYNRKNMAGIYSSRLESTNVIGKAIARCEVKPTCWINSASATIYRHSLDTPMTEAQGEYGRGFSVDVCKQWEACFFNHSFHNVRQVALRTAIVLGNDGGVMKPFRNLVKVGLGGKMGNGNQQFSWIHELDFCRAVEFLLHHETSRGVYNIASPYPIINDYFMSTLRHQYHRAFGLNLKKWMLEIGALFIQTETELILKSRYVIPEKLVGEGFQFRFEKIEEAVENLAI